MKFLAPAEQLCISTPLIKLWGGLSVFSYDHYKYVFFPNFIPDNKMYASGGKKNVFKNCLSQKAMAQ